MNLLLIAQLGAMLRQLRERKMKREPLQAVEKPVPSLDTPQVTNFFEELRRNPPFRLTPDGRVVETPRSRRSR